MHAAFTATRSVPGPYEIDFRILVHEDIRWISARGKQTIQYGAFLAPIPPGTTGVKDVTLNGNIVKIELDGVDKTISLKVK